MLLQLPKLLLIRELQIKLSKKYKKRMRINYAILTQANGFWSLHDPKALARFDEHPETKFPHPVRKLIDRHCHGKDVRVECNKAKCSMLTPMGRRRRASSRRPCPRRWARTRSRWAGPPAWSRSCPSSPATRRSCLEKSTTCIISRSWGQKCRESKKAEVLAEVACANHGLMDQCKLNSMKTLSWYERICPVILD